MINKRIDVELMVRWIEQPPMTKGRC